MPPVAVDGLHCGGDDDRAMLVLEFDSQPPEAAFAARKVASRHFCDEDFVTVADWTPNKVASLSTRHYIHGGAGEIKRLAAHLAGRSDRLVYHCAPVYLDS